MLVVAIMLMVVRKCSTAIRDMQPRLVPILWEVFHLNSNYELA